jgi:PEP-CTERM motif
VGAKVAAAAAAVALSSASASIVGVIYTGAVSVRYDSGGTPNFNVVADRARLGKAAGLAATNVHFGSAPDPQVESGSPCRDDMEKGCFVVFPSPELKFSFFGHTISLPAEWNNVDWGEDLYRGGQQRFLSLFSAHDLVISKNAPDSTGQEDAATVVNSDGTSRQTQISDSYPIGSDAGAIYDPNVIYNPNVIGEAQPNPIPIEMAQSPVPSLLSAAPTSTIPEPSTWTLILAGFAALALGRLRWARATRSKQRV